jgi:CRISPR system Cascade subunit CasE
MSGLQMIECHLDQTALLRFLRAQGLDDSRHGPDLGYGIHAWMKAAFGDLSPRTWRLLADRKRPVRVLGYGQAPAEALIGRLRDFGEPGVQAVCPPEGIAGKAMPRWTAGRELGFELLCCPVGRKAGQKTEKDLFLLKADHVPGDEPLVRATIYSDWARARLETDGAAQVDRLWLDGFRRVRLQRKRQAPPGERAICNLERPEAVMAGMLRIGDSHAFERLLARGVGRHRAFGYGMLLLRPPAR